MEPCLCDRCVGIEYAERAQRRLVALRETASRWDRRVGWIQIASIYAIFAAIGVMLLGFVWHAACLTLGWHDPLDLWWLHNAVIATLATSILAAICLDKLSSWLFATVGDLTKSEEDLQRSTGNAFTTRAWLRDIRNCRRSA